MLQVPNMDFPVVNAIVARTQQVVRMPLAVASDVAHRGLIAPRAYGMRGHALSMWESRPRLFGLGTSSTAANAGIEKNLRIY